MPIKVFTNNVVAENGVPTTGGDLHAGVVDSTLSSSTPTTNEGASGFVDVNFNSGADRKNLAIRVNSFGSTLPAGAVISSATLYMNIIFSDVTSNINVNELLIAFTELGSTWDNSAVATPWNTPGALGVGTDIVGTPVFTTTIDAVSGYKSFDITALAQSVADASTDLNMLISVDIATPGDKAFTSSDGADGQRPEVVVVYTVPAGDTTPDAFTVGADVVDAALNQVVERNFVIAGIDTLTTFTATGAGLVSLTSGAGFGASVNANNGDTIYLQLTASGSNSALVTGGVTAGGISDSFNITTVAATALSASETLESASGVPVASQTLDFVLRASWNGAITDQGTLTTNASGLFSISGLNAVAGTSWITIKNQGDDDIAVTFPIAVA